MVTSSRSVLTLLRQILVWMAKSAAALIAFGITLVAILLVVMWFEHRAEMTLPKPTGPFAVGRISYAWTNASQKATKRAGGPQPERQRDRVDLVSGSSLHDPPQPRSDICLLRVAVGPSRDSLGIFKCDRSSSAIRRWCMPTALSDAPVTRANPPMRCVCSEREGAL